MYARAVPSFLLIKQYAHAYSRCASMTASSNGTETDGWRWPDRGL